MGETTNLDVSCPKSPQKSPVQSSGIPHLAKNERDVGHPSSAASREEI